MEETTPQITDHPNSQDGEAAEQLAVVSEEQAALDNLELISQLVQQLAANENQYELHVQLIQALRRAAMFDELRTAREQMHKIFPMSEALWLEWIEDEKRMASNKEGKEHIVTLFKKALDDYISIPIWVAYINYIAKSDVSEDEDDAMDRDSDHDDHDEGDIGYTIEEKREVLLRAVSATQWHVPQCTRNDYLIFLSVNTTTQSHLVWNLYRNFEEKLLKVICITRLENPQGRNWPPPRNSLCSLHWRVFLTHLAASSRPVLSNFNESKTCISNDLPFHTRHLMLLSPPTPLLSAPTIPLIMRQFWWPRTRLLPTHESATTRRGSRSNGVWCVFFFQLFARSYCPLLLAFTGPYFDTHCLSDYPLQIQSSNALLDFFAYLDWERSHRGSDSFAVRTLFERAVAVHCLVPSLWEEYLYYLVEKFSVPNIMIETAERAVRNCPWAGDLWAEYARIWVCTGFRVCYVGQVLNSVSIPPAAILRLYSPRRDLLFVDSCRRCRAAHMMRSWVSFGISFYYLLAESRYLYLTFPFAFNGSLLTVSLTINSGDPTARLGGRHGSGERGRVGQGYAGAVRSRKARNRVGQRNADRTDFVSNFEEGGVTDEEAEYIRAVFKEALDTVAKVFPEGDPYYRLERYHAEIEATKLDNVKEARKVWESIIKRHGTEAEAWLRYIEFERRHGDLAGCETLLKRAVQRKLDWLERLLDAWVAFEHEEGSLESTHYALTRVRRRAREVEIQRQTTVGSCAVFLFFFSGNEQEAALTAEQMAVAGEKQKKKTEKDVAYKQKKRANYYEKRANKNEEKRKRESGSAEPEGSPGSKRSKREEEGTREEGTREAEAGHQERPAAEAEASKANSMGPPAFVPRRQQQKQKSRPGQAEHGTEGEAARNGGNGDEPITRRLAGQRPHAKLSKGTRGGRGGVLGRGGKGPVDEAGGSEGVVGDGGSGGQAEPPQKKSNADFRAMYLGSK
ncbi:hypothetical protein BC937DRAFT_90468 [Endogone sp. FLAS-F59071]|nr:hypothetical protein BC937DRAFT_90468 [Endogone sp. FLAS-F59071]|eukprot:RUS17063.1 hypothetical protein BC937DRAFT_90468 [Endogone sp. FLAS-F59071]